MHVPPVFHVSLLRPVVPDPLDHGEAETTPTTAVEVRLTTAGFQVESIPGQLGGLWHRGKELGTGSGYTQWWAHLCVPPDSNCLTPRTAGRVSRRAEHATKCMFVFIANVITCFFPPGPCSDFSGYTKLSLRKHEILAVFLFCLISQQ